MIVRKPMTTEQKERKEQKTLPSAEDIRRAQDELFMNLLQRMAQLEEKKS